MTREEAINVVKNNWPDSSYTRLREALETLIPELKESEDEKIKKFIRLTLEEKYVVDGIVNSVDADNAFAWLEKQCEQKPIGLEYAAKKFLEELSKTPYNNKPITDAQVITRELLNFLQNSASYNPDALNIQQPAEWSEEDENYYIYANVAIDYYFDENYAEELRGWLKSLKDRCTWKPSDEQMDALSRKLPVTKGSGIWLAPYSNHSTPTCRNYKKGG